MKRHLLTLLIPCAIAVIGLRLAYGAPTLAFRATGDFACINNDSNPIPLNFARVEIWRSGLVTNDLMAIGGTNASGHFDIEVWSDDPWVFANLQKLDLHAVGVFDDDYPSTPDTLQKTVGHPVKHINENHSSISFKVPTSGSIHVQNGLADFGSWVNGTDLNRSGSDNSSHCGVWMGSRNAYAKYIEVVGEFPPVNQYDVLSIGYTGTPWTALETTNWPHYYHTGTNESVNAHEFGHAIRHSFDGDRNHFLGDATSFRYAREHSLCNSNHLADAQGTRMGYAFNEGWAEFWEDAVSGCDGVVTAGDMTVEGEVARTLYHLSNCLGHNNPGKAGMVQVLKKNPGRIHSYQEFQQHFYEEFPRCVGTRRDALTMPGPRRPPTEPTVRTPSHVTAVSPALTKARRQQLLSAHSTALANLKDELKAAEASAKSVAPCKGDTCTTAIRTLVAPPVLDAAAKLLHIERLRFDSLASTDVQTLILQDKYLATSRSDVAAYNKTRADVVRTALTKSIQSAESLQRSSPDATVLILELRRELQRFEKALREGGAPTVRNQTSILFQNDDKVKRAGLVPR